MSQLIDRPEIAGELREYLEQQASKGNKWVAYDTDNPISTKYVLHCFPGEEEALDFAREYQQIFNWHEAVPISDLLSELKRLEQVAGNVAQSKTDLIVNKKDMNRNNLEKLKKEMKSLGFGEDLQAEMEKNIEKGNTEFQLHSQRKITGGQIDYSLHFKKSNQSEYYYLNKYETSLNNGKALEEGQKYMVISPGEKGKPVFRSFQNPQEAIGYFKGQKGDSELALGKSPASKTQLATMEKGTVNFVSDEFKKTYYSPAITQTFYVEKGKGFTAEQAANLVQGRSVYRDDLLNIAGNPYKAWIKLDFDKPKDRFHNFTTNQYHVPSYGFDLEKTLEKYNLKELEDPKKRQALISSLQDGNRPVITTHKDGEEVKLYIEAVPRYGNVNVFNDKGRPEKREQFEKPVKTVQKLVTNKSKSKNKEKAESHEMSI
nr:hypothetical protein [uncultured Pedobacter sp.]